MEEAHELPSAAAAPPLPPLPALRAFVAVAETGGFSRAAERLNVTQTAVSHQIRQLEDWLGRKLFRRDTRSVAITDAGAALLPRVRAALDDLAAALSEVREQSQDERLVVAAPPEFAAQWLAPRLPAFLADHPDLDVRLIAEYRRARFFDDGIDAAILLGCGGPGQRADRLGMEEEFAVCSPDLAARLPRHNAFAEAPFLRYAGDRHTALDWRRWLEQLGLCPPGQVMVIGSGPRIRRVDPDDGPCYSTFPDMLEACRQGAGFALVQTSLVADDMALGHLVRPFFEALPSDLHYHLVCPAETADRSKIAAFRRWVLAEAETSGLV